MSHIADTATNSDSHVERVNRLFTLRDAGCVCVLVVFLLVYFFPFLARNSTVFRIGNDFAILYSNYATYLVDAARNGFWPWWNPNEACGFPLYSSPFSAFFYPGRVLSLALAVGSPVYSWSHHQAYMVIGICLLSVGLYSWLRGRGTGAPAALFAAVVIAIGYRVADNYRFPNAIHAAAWMPWVLFAYDRWLSGAVVSGYLLGTVALLCLATAGYPYYTIYASVLVLSYVVLRIAEGVPWSRATIALASLAGPVACLILPYYIAMSRLLSQTVDRTGTSYLFSVAHNWTYLDLLGGLVFPLSAVSEGWLYCGIMPVLMVLTWVATAKPKGPDLVWALGLALFVHLVAAGSGSFVFPVLWTFVPVFSGLRVWARFTIILLPALALLIAAAYEGMSSTAFDRQLARQSVWRAAATVAVIQLGLWTTKTFSSYLSYWPFMQASAFVFATIVGAVYLVLWTSWGRTSGIKWALLGLLVTASDTGTYGRQIWRESVGAEIPTTSLNLADYYRGFFDRPRTDDVGMLLPYAPTSGIMPNWYFQRYVTFRRRYADQPDMPELIGSKGRKLFFSRTLDALPDQFTAWWDERIEFETTAQSVVSVTAPYNGNSLQLSYASNRPGYLIFVDNWDPDWRATVNGREVPIRVAFGTFKAVEVPAGKGTVTFDYKPTLPHLWMLLLGGALVGLVAGRGWRHRPSLLTHAA